MIDRQESHESHEGKKVIPLLDQSAFPEWYVGDFSIHRNIMVAWNSEKDPRVIDWIEWQPCWIIDQLVIVSENYGQLYLLWKQGIPPGYAVGREFMMDSEEKEFDDAWRVVDSIPM